MINENVAALASNKPEEINPNIAQSAASNPECSAWVAASAGTGKTKVLTDRVLRLLLPREDGQSGTPPRRIVCLTFTKAAANEMAVRITKKLGSWAVMDENHADPKKSLAQILEDLLGYKPAQDHIEAAKRLFAEVVDCPGGLQIMTIHSFCQSILGRFPLEAGVPPDFTVLEESEAMDLMRRAQASVIEDAQHPSKSGSELSNALHNMMVELDYESFSDQVAALCRERKQLYSLLQRYNDVGGIYAQICSVYDIAQGADEYDAVKSLCDIDSMYEGDLREAAQILLEDSGKLAPARARTALEWLSESQEGRVKLFGEYKNCYLTRNDTIHKQAFPPKKIDKKFPHIKDILLKEAERVVEAVDIMKRCKSASMTRDILDIAIEVLSAYERLKQKRGGLDFDDLIYRTMDLLTGNTHALSSLFKSHQEEVMPWILYKLDQGIDHVLVDEAQDTNPEQWRIIEALSDEFFAGLSARDDVVRTSFTVGDIKQSIYGFQRAAPEEFKRMQIVFDQKIKNAGQVNEVIPLDVSFRSTKSVLKVVDAVFDDPALKRALGEDSIHHKVFRQGQGGVVELWPVFETQKMDRKDIWSPEVQVQAQSGGSENLATYIADKIRNMLDRKEILSSYGRCIQPGDIMILVRSRSVIVERVIRALKAKGIAVNGSDRMILGDQVAVQDVLAMARFCLLPEDNLTLGEVLKSPFMGWSEEELFSISCSRTGSLWSNLCNFKGEDLNGNYGCINKDKLEKTRLYLSRMIGRAQVLGAYEFFSCLLTEGCPADEYSGLRAICKRLGEDAFDPIEELMNEALNFTYDNPDHLQLFLEEQEKSKSQIKREMEEGGDKVRVMTVHGSKGLQAPIVIMPDTMIGGGVKKGENFLWPAKTELNVPLYASRKDNRPDTYTKYYDHCLSNSQDEYYRLLYVAMTRASDRLYVAGYSGKTSPKEDSWYYMIKNAMSENADVQIIQEEEGEVLRIANAQKTDPDKVVVKQIAEEEIKSIEDWVFEMPKEEPFPPSPLVPSKPSQQEEEVSLSPLAASHSKKFIRGNITHKLLEFLPDFPIEKRNDAAIKFVRKNAGELSNVVQENIVQEVMAVLCNPDFTNFFKQGSMAEVPITGLMSDNRIVSGQIDRLLVEENDIWIVDYKTNRPAPIDPENIPQIYKNQLQAYHDVMRKIYPEHKIHCALLWTDGPRLMLINVES